MQKVGVLGLGNWGTALGNHLALKGYDVLGWSIEAPVIEGINKHNRNPVYLSDIMLSSNLRATSSLDDVVERNTIVVVVPSSVLGEVAAQLKVRKGTLLISAIKGLEEKTLLTPVFYLEQQTKGLAKCVVLSGPSFARDIAAGKLCGIVAASRDREASAEATELFASESMRVYMSLDPLGVEIGAVVKNVIALAAGICDGMGLGDSARAGLITRGLAEMMRLACGLGAKEKTLAGLSGLGDLVMTATCDVSRNRTVGLRLGRGEKLADIVSTLGSVAEAVKTTPLVLALAQKHGIEMPIAEQVSKLLLGDITAKEAVEALIKRPLKMEF